MSNCTLNSVYKYITVMILVSLVQHQANHCSHDGQQARSYNSKNELQQSLLLQMADGLQDVSPRRQSGLTLQCVARPSIASSPPPPPPSLVLSSSSSSVPLFHNELAKAQLLAEQNKQEISLVNKTSFEPNPKAPSSFNQPQIVVLPASSAQIDDGDESDDETPLPDPPIQGHQVQYQDRDDPRTSPSTRDEDELPESKGQSSGQLMDVQEEDEERGANVQSDEDDDLGRDYDETSADQGDPLGSGRRSKLWSNLRRARFLAKIKQSSRMLNQNRRVEQQQVQPAEFEERRAPRSRRLKRQSDLVNGAGDAGQQQRQLVDTISQLITRSLVNAQQQRQQINQQLNPLQSILNTAVPVGTRLATDILQQGIDSIPVRMANMGQLLANLITLLTVNNPMLINSPLLLRTRLLNGSTNSTVDLSGSGVGGGSGAADGTIGAQPQPSLLMGVLINVIRALTPAQPPQENRSPDELPISASNDDNNKLQQQNQSSPQMAASRIRPTTTVSNQSDGLKARPKLDVEIDFINRLNALTLGRMNETTLARLGPEKKRRHKRSIGSMLMFGPFSKIYMAMMMHRLVKHQSSILTQAIMGELVRRFVIPGFSSALGQTGLTSTSQLLNQARQTLIRAAGGQLPSGAPGVGQGVLSNPVAPSGAELTLETGASVPASAKSLFNPVSGANKQQNQLQQQQQLNGPTTDCKLVQEDDQGFQRTILDMPNVSPETQQLLQFLSMPGNLLSNAINNPPISLGQKRVSINLPLSQSSLTIPTSLNGQQALLKSIAENWLSSLSPNAEHQILALLSSALNLPSGRTLRLRPGQRPVANGRDRYPNQSRHGKQSSAYRNKALVPYDLPPVNSDASPPLEALFELSNNNNRQTDVDLMKLMMMMVANNSSNQPSIESILSQASPNQLLELLNRSNSSLTSQVDPKKAQPDDQERQMQSLLASLMLSSNQGELFKQEANINGSSSINNNNPNNKLFESADVIADKLLNRTMIAWAENLMMANRTNSGSNTQTTHGSLMRDASTTIANSLGHILKSIDGFGSINPVNDDDNDDDSKSKSKGNSKSVLNTTSSHQASNMDETVPIGANEGASKAPIQITLTADNAATLMDKLISLNLPKHDLNPSSDSKSSKTAHQNSTRHQASSTQQSKPHPQTVPKSPDTKKTKNQEAIPKSFKSSLSALKSHKNQQKPTTPKSTDKRSDSNGHRHNDTSTLPQKSNSSSLEDDHKNNSNNTQSRQAEKLSLTSPNQSNNSTTSINADTRDSSMKNNANSQQQQPLNNLAMALNVMNMVLLNQRLMAASNSSNWNLSQSGDHANKSSFAAGKTNPPGEDVGILKRPRTRLSNGRKGYRRKPTKSTTSRPTTSPASLAGDSDIELISSKEETTGQSTKEQSTKSSGSSEGGKDNMNTNNKSNNNNNGTSNNENHRSSSSVIRLEPNVITISRNSSAATPIKPVEARKLNYHFKPLVASSTRNTTDSVNLNTTSATNGDQAIKLASNESEISESDHAERWNDVLQHLDLAA